MGVTKGIASYGEYGPKQALQYPLVPATPYDLNIDLVFNDIDSIAFDAGTPNDGFTVTKTGNTVNFTYTDFALPPQGQGPTKVYVLNATNEAGTTQMFLYFVATAV